MNELKIAFVLGTRPEILKLGSVIQEAKKRGYECTVVHTGQHYDHNMSSVFFEDLGLPEPDVFIGVGSGTQGYQTGRGIIEVEKYLQEAMPNVVAVVGDTNAGVSGALAACKLGIPVAHFEAGARSFDWTMPEELNRRLLDSISRFCFAPTEVCLSRLKHEGRAKDSWYVGDTLVETALPISKKIRSDSTILSRLGVNENNYGLLTIHRAENTDNLERLASILGALNEIDFTIAFPVHPRTRKRITENGLSDITRNLKLVDPLPYKEFLTMIAHASFVITDSGGVQQEASIFGKRCLTVRDNTEWVETIFAGGNKLVKADKGAIKAEVESILSCSGNEKFENPFKLGASERALDLLQDAWIKGEMCYPKSNYFDEKYEDIVKRYS